MGTGAGTASMNAPSPGLPSPRPRQFTPNRHTVISVLSSKVAPAPALLTTLTPTTSDDTDPIIYLLYEFLACPSSSFPARMWAVTMLLLACAKLLLVCVTSLDTPGQYPASHSSSNAYYSFVPGADSLWVAFLVLAIPLILDASLRAAMALLVLLGAGDGATSKARIELTRGDLSSWLLLAEVLSVVPYFVEISLTTTHGGSSSGSSTDIASSQGGMSFHVNVSMPVKCQIYRNDKS